MASRTATKMEAVLDYATNTVKEATVGIHTECLMSVHDVSVDGPTVIYAGPALLLGVYVNTSIATATVVLADNTTAKVTLPVSLAAGASVNCYGARFETTLVIDPGDTATGNVTVFYRPL